jgi:hypothetical protein
LNRKSGNFSVSLKLFGVALVVLILINTFSMHAFVFQSVLTMLEIHGVHQRKKSS